MHTDFWFEKWDKNEIAFHQKEGNPLFGQYFQQLGLAKGARVFLPLCGKTGDIGRLLSWGYRVVGVELSHLAIEQLFADLGIEPRVYREGGFVRYSGQSVDIFVGDMFNLTLSQLGAIDAVYDRAALVAMPLDMRDQYCTHLLEIAGHVQQLLICFEYDQSQMPGPPFSVDKAEVRQRYQSHYELSLMDSVDVPGGLKGKCEAQELVWLLRPAGSQDI